ncbi:MAG: hypothetical protein ACLFT4_07260 [Bacteroidales bacterium]
MSENQEQRIVSYKISAVELLNLEMKHPQQEKIDFNSFHFDLKLQHRVNTEKKLVFVISTVNILDKEKTIQLGTIQTSCIFAIDNINDLIDNENNVRFPDNFLDEINSIAISTTRGIMYTEFKGTILHKSVHPIFKMENLKKKKE